MATFKLTFKRGQKKVDIARSSGSSISGSDAIEVNVDTTAMSKLEVVQGLDYIKQRILEQGFPE